MKNLTHDEISILDSFVPYPIIIYNHERVLFFNSHFEELDIEASYMLNYARSNSIKELFKSDIILFTRHKEKRSYEVTSEAVSVDDEECYLSFFVDITEKKKKEQKLRKMSASREGLLEINKTIIASNNLHIILNNVLKNALKAIDKADLGAVFIIDNAYFKLVSYLGFGKEIEAYTFIVEESFLYTSTEGKMDRIMISGDKNKFSKSLPGLSQEGALLQSTISSPIYTNNMFLGMVNVYSTMKDAFDKDDYKTMEYIRNNIEIAVANHLSLTEKDIDAEYDSLTKIYNWNFIGNQFKKYRERANENYEKFYVVLINIDRLKRTNLSFGHLAGDKIIIRVASEIIKITSQNDVVIRFDGDEFIGIFYNTTGDKLKRKLDSIKRSLQNDPVIINSTVIVPSVTYGVSCYPDDGKVLEELVNAADEQMNFKKIGQHIRTDSDK